MSRLGVNEKRADAVAIGAFRGESERMIRYEMRNSVR